jgi:hypothetical protein
MELSTVMAKSSEDEKKRDETLKRMLKTPHKPHVAKKPEKKVSKNAKAKTRSDNS